MTNALQRPRLLLIEDDPQVAEVVSEVARASGFRIDTRRDGISGAEAAREPTYDLILLDIMLPDKDGWSICKELRCEGNEIPIIMLTAKTSESDRISGLTMGADDYVVKPFSPRELIARIRAVLKRSRARGTVADNRTGVFSFSSIGLIIDTIARTVAVDGREVDFPPREFDLITFLARNTDRALSREQILYHVWPERHTDDTRTVAEHVKRIRKRLETAGVSKMPIQTVWGIGYRFSTKTTSE